MPIRYLSNKSQSGRIWTEQKREGRKRPARAAWERPFLLPCFSPSDPGDAPELLMILGGFLYGSFHFTA